MFRIFDTFLYFTPIVFQCYTTGTHITYTASTDVKENFVRPEKLAINMMFEFFYIVSDILG